MIYDTFKTIKCKIYNTVMNLLIFNENKILYLDSNIHTRDYKKVKVLIYF